MIVDHLGASREQRVMDETWGHLKADFSRAHRGVIVFGLDEYGNESFALRVDFPEVPDSPWFFEHLNLWLDDQEMESGCLYVFRGVYHEGGFEGTVEPLPLIVP